MKIEINVPTHLNEITLGQYQKFLKIAENNPEGDFLNAKMIEIFCGIPLSDAYTLKMSSVTAITDILHKLFEDTSQEHVERFEMFGIKYGFTPDLDDLTLGEYVDLDNNASKWEEMHVAMNVLYRPIVQSNKEKYRIEEYSVANSERMKDMPLDAAIGSLFFFYNLGAELSKHTILSSESREEMEDIQVRQTLEQNGGGINLFMHSLTDVLSGLKISLN